MPKLAVHAVQAICHYSTQTQVSVYSDLQLRSPCFHSLGLNGSLCWQNFKLRLFPTGLRVEIPPRYKVAFKVPWLKVAFSVAKTPITIAQTQWWSSDDCNCRHTVLTLSVTYFYYVFTVNPNIFGFLQLIRLSGMVVKTLRQFINYTVFSFICQRTCQGSFHIGYNIYLVNEIWMPPWERLK